MSHTDKVSQYVRLLDDHIKLNHSEQGRDEEDLLNQLDLLWYSLDEKEMLRAEAASKALHGYYEGRK